MCWLLKLENMIFVKTVHVINWAVLNPRILSALLDEPVSSYTVLMLYTEVCFLSRGRILGSEMLFSVDHHH